MHGHLNVKKSYIISHLVNWRRDSSVSVVTGRRRSESCISSRAKWSFSSLISAIPAVGSSASLLVSLWHGLYDRRWKRTGRASDDQPHLASKNGLPLNFVMWCLIKHRGNSAWCRWRWCCCVCVESLDCSSASRRHPRFPALRAPDILS